MSNENRSDSGTDKKLRRKSRDTTPPQTGKFRNSGKSVWEFSSDTIPPQTGKFRNLFEEMQNRQNKEEPKNQARVDSERNSSRSQNSGE